MTRKKAGEAAQTRARILQSAIDRFAKRGFASTSMSDLARAVGMTQGVLYFHFESKEALLVAAIDELVKRLDDELGSAAAGDAAPRKKKPRSSADLLEILVARVAHVAKKHPEYFLFVGVVGVEATDTNPRVERAVREAYGRISRIVKELCAAGIAEGELEPTLDVEAASELFLGMYMGGLLQLRLFRGRLPKERALASLATMMSACLRRRDRQGSHAQT